MNIKDAYYKARDFFEVNKRENKEVICLEIRMMICYAAKIDNKDFWQSFLGLIKVDVDYDNSLLPLLVKRASHMPLDKVLSTSEFYELSFEINKNVLAPRVCTEKLVDLSKEFLNKQKEGVRILELGVGSGCNIIVLAKMFSKHSFVGVDICSKALEIAKKNAKRHNVRNIKWIVSNWWENVKGKFDLVISNPPYIKTSDIVTLAKEVKNHDPILALDGGEDGLACFRIILNEAALFLNAYGKASAIILEIGKCQLPELKTIIENKGFVLNKIIEDDLGIERIIALEKQGE